MGVKLKDNQVKDQKNEEPITCNKQREDQDLSQSGISPKSKTGKVLSEGYMHIHEEAETEEKTAYNWGKG